MDCKGPQKITQDHKGLLERPQRTAKERTVIELQRTSTKCAQDHYKGPSRSLNSSSLVDRLDRLATGAIVIAQCHAIVYVNDCVWQGYVIRSLNVASFTGNVIMEHIGDIIVDLVYFKTDNCCWRSVPLNGHILRVICCVTKILCDPLRCLVVPYSD